ncbi:c-type cytochrome [Stieleria maiorica]|uniref:c-type cytochrome n=1 Tax=Stieleria maiorica TaxID=2795974 RepID=UPI00142F345C|nr:c-type cytochrome [Stieleria maiorica]
MKVHSLILTVAFLFLVPPQARSAENDSRADQAQARQDAVIVRAIERISDYDYRSDPAVAEAVMRQIRRSQGTPEFMRLVKRFKPDGIETQLVKTLVGDDRSAAVESAALLLELDAGRKAIRRRLNSTGQAVAVIETLGLLGNGRANHFLAEIVSDAERPYDQRRAAVTGLAKSNDGEKRLVALATEKKLVGDTFLVAGALLARSKDGGIRDAAAKVLPQPALKDAKPLPPIDELAQLRGDVAAGLKLFRGEATCANCHIVNDYGKDVGPNLSEIGTKLSREAMLTAVLAPSAGISHNYENFSVLTEEGQVITGLKISQTDNEIVIRTADAIDRTIPGEEVVTIKKSDTSIMPENLHHITGQQGLVDIVEYMMTLKKKG